MEGCIFCGVVAGDVASVEVLSTPGAYAFRDVNPAAPVHVLVVPRRHIPDASSLGA
ncbi:MAG: HIT family protein, partial [Acidimicrobiales bacterium]